MYPFGNSPNRSLTALAIVVTLLLLASLTGPGCRRKAGVGEDMAHEIQAALDQDQEKTGGESGDEESQGAERVVEVNLYFGMEKGGKLHLRAERRAITYQGDLYSAVLRELIKGPATGSGLRRVLPPATRVLGTRLEGGVLVADFSKEIILDAPTLGTGAEGEALALASLANTMTELPGVDRVKVLVEGKDRGMVDGRAVEDFWGHVGLPEYLERNEGLILK